MPFLGYMSVVTYHTKYIKLNNWQITVMNVSFLAVEHRQFITNQ